MNTEHIEKEKQLKKPEVVSVDFKTFIDLEKKYPDANDIAMSTFSELKPDEVVTNVGAGPCLIIWEFDQDTGIMTKSGHFPDVSTNWLKNITARRISEMTKRFEREGGGKIEVANEEHIRHFGYPQKKESIDSYTQFTKLGDQISDEILNGQTQKMIFLFGQNFVVYPDGVERDQSIAKNALQHFEVTTIIRQWGIPESRIIDHRSADHNGGDNTIYIPEENTIYHFHRKKNEPYPYD